MFARGVDEFLAADIDPDMRNMALSLAKKDQVARLDIVQTYLLAHIADFLCSARQLLTHGFPEQIADKCAAIQATIGIGAAEAIADTTRQAAHGFFCQQAID